MEPLMPGTRRLAVRATVLACLAFAPAAAFAQGGSSAEYQVKAVFLSKFASFVTWPDATFDDRSSPITIGVLGTDPFGNSLEEAVQGEVINGRPLRIRHLQSKAEAAECQIVFIRERDASRLGPILSPLRDSPVLTVGETANFTRVGGIVNFVLKDGRVRIEFNPDAADRAGLRINSKLLSVSTIVK